MSSVRHLFTLVDWTLLLERLGRLKLEVSELRLLREYRSPHLTAAAAGAAGAAVATVTAAARFAFVPSQRSATDRLLRDARSPLDPLRALL